MRRLPFITFFGLALWEAHNFKVKKFYRGNKGFQYQPSAPVTPKDTGAHLGHAFC